MLVRVAASLWCAQLLVMPPQIHRRPRLQDKGGTLRVSSSGFKQCVARTSGGRVRAKVSVGNRGLRVSPTVSLRIGTGVGVQDQGQRQAEGGVSG